MAHGPHTGSYARSVRPSPATRLKELFWRRIWHVSSLLFALAWVWRRLLVRTTFIGVTGSLGKTTCKEISANVLATRYRTRRSWQNLNARAGVAINILRVRPWDRYAVIEVAVGAPGDMDRAARVLRPNVAAVLCLKGTHTTAFGDLERHAAEKAKLLAAVRPGGLAVLNADDPLVRAMRVPPTVRVCRIGLAEGADVRGAVISAQWPDRLSLRVSARGETQTVSTRLIGAHWWPTVLAAVAIGLESGVPLAEAGRAIAATEPFPGRLQPLQLPGGAVLVRDDYNASVDASAPLFRILAEARADRRILILTDMSDAGVNRKHRIRMIVAEAARCADVLVLIGDMAEWGARRAVEAGIAEGCARGFPAMREAAEFLRTELRAGDVAFIKGRTTDHAARIAWAQFGPVACWREYCPKRMLCDECWELGSPAGGRALPTPPVVGLD